MQTSERANTSEQAAEAHRRIESNYYNNITLIITIIISMYIYIYIYIHTCIIIIIIIIVNNNIIIMYIHIYRERERVDACARCPRAQAQVSGRACPRSRYVYLKLIYLVQRKECALAFCLGLAASWACASPTWQGLPAGFGPPTACAGRWMMIAIHVGVEKRHLGLEVRVGSKNTRLDK